MQTRLTKKLLEAAPSVFPKDYRDRDFFFETRDGWFDIILKVGIALHRMNLENNWTEPLIASQVKEKFGTLRFYLHPTNGDIETAEKIIHEAAQQSAKTCEYCGKPGKLRKRFWLKTLCVDCALQDEKITPEEAKKELDEVTKV